MKKDINSIFHMLSWNRDKETQIKGIQEGKKIKNLSVFMQPIEDKSIWENCAKIIVSKQDEELRPYLINLFEWIADMNWPGATIICERLKTIPADFIYNSYYDSIKKAILLEDENWLLWLEEFLENNKLKEMLDKNIVKKLEDNKKRLIED